MKYDNTDLLKIKAECEMMNMTLGIELIGYINRAINIKSELEKVEKILSTPKRTQQDIVRHMELIIEYKEAFANQMKAVREIKNITQSVVVGLEHDYAKTVQIIKGRV